MITLLTAAVLITNPFIHQDRTDLADINITVEETWEVTFAADMQDIAVCQSQGTLLLRSNTEGKIYTVDTGTFTPVDSISMPAGVEGFGLCARYDYPEGMQYFIHDTATGTILTNNGSDTWVEVPAPVSASGAGMDLLDAFNDDYFFQAVSDIPPFFNSYCVSDSTTDSWILPGISEEISGFMVHEVMTLNSGYLPCAAVTTTRHGHEMFFFWTDSPDCTLYGQEDCPLTVEESLGLAWRFNFGDVFWGWKGTDGKYYVSLLNIPIFGAIEDESTGMTSSSHLYAVGNPASGTASLGISLPGPAQVSLVVYDSAGRVVETILSNEEISGETLETFTGPPGIYTAKLAMPAGEETLRFAITP